VIAAAVIAAAVIAAAVISASSLCETRGRIQRCKGEDAHQRECGNGYRSNEMAHRACLLEADVRVNICPSLVTCLRTNLTNRGKPRAKRRRRSPASTSPSE
jgi:1,4-dihydroxy-2-naphthoyl-CoA synthase